ncbi:DUF2249 domain-containing protein [Magnetovibrio blakemorei]|uniref:DUF2249 domain-containing protein n=1 Tax=Magnetovibrio blakemorei TaxID=28181 RepID=A0A1E5Q606_9PROT|nr:DUF2249 domain-containing protein [Magnetovibrio blakemorei]OEJ66180.1 hypothetical protein BEN30_12335 [Magnetovibrio blakemorei]
MVKRWRDNDVVHLDLRGLAPPEPMIKVLSEIDGGADYPIIVHLERDPIFLYQELEERGWSGRLMNEEQNNASGEAVVMIELKPDVTR